MLFLYQYSKDVLFRDGSASFFLPMSLTSGSIHIWFSIQKEHCEIKNEDSKKITIRAIGDARVLVNGEPVDDDEEEELHHLDRYFLWLLLSHSILHCFLNKGRAHHRCIIGRFHHKGARPMYSFYGQHFGFRYVAFQ